MLAVHCPCKWFVGLLVLHAHYQALHQRNAPVVHLKLPRLSDTCETTLNLAHACAANLAKSDDLDILPIGVGHKEIPHAKIPNAGCSCLEQGQHCYLCHLARSSLASSVFSNSFVFFSVQSCIYRHL
jgi:hypothetical protein